MFSFLYAVFFCVITIVLTVLCMHFSGVSARRVLPLLINDDDDDDDSA